MNLPRSRAVCLIVLDSAGIGDAPDAAAFGDEGSATLPNIARAVGGLSLPNMAAVGLGNIVDIDGVSPAAPSGAYGSMIETSPGKDTTTGHWEIAGIVLDKPFPLYPEGFPAELVEVYRLIRGEHPDWTEYRQAMVADRRLVLRIDVTRIYGWSPG